MHGLEHLFNIDVLSEFDFSKIMGVIGGLIASLGAVFADMFMIQLTAIFILWLICWWVIFASRELWVKVWAYQRSLCFCH
ncbi:MAG: hypothetical protein RQ733_08900 [Methyloprofundus sp.]|nr:hypothetical protein [Methyloprofundus sp.]MDT8426077.1 hypothetical protein [Methyloprofundus sp.]